MDYGTIIVVGAVLLFYLRLITLQWGKAKRAKESRIPVPTAVKKRKGQNAAAQPEPEPAQSWMSFRFVNGYLVILSLLLMVLGVVLNAYTALPPTLRGFWWIPVTVGIALFGFMIR